MTTITVDSHDTRYLGGTVFVAEQDDLSELTLPLPSLAERAEYVLVHDRQKGYVIPRRTVSALARHGLSSVSLTTLSERPVSPAEPVSIDFVAGPIRQRFVALPSLPEGSEATSTPKPSDDTMVGLPPLDQYRELLRVAYSEKAATRIVWN